jgi:hypothetical protein
VRLPYGASGAERCTWQKIALHDDVVLQVQAGLPAALVAECTPSCDRFGCVYMLEPVVQELVHEVHVGLPAFARVR